LEKQLELNNSFYSNRANFKNQKEQNFDPSQTTTKKAPQNQTLKKEQIDLLGHYLHFHLKQQHIPFESVDSYFEEDANGQIDWQTMKDGFANAPFDVRDSA
jgi:hypothetical protein